ncbi:MAG: hypothetical protein R2746_04305 [Acidimicrobiales bacterium]
MEQTHRSLWLNASTFRWQAGVSDRDVYLHTLPVFTATDGGMPLRHHRHTGVRQVVLRRSTTAPRSCRVHSQVITFMCGAAVVNMILDAAATWDGPIPGAGHLRHRGGRRAATHPHDRTGGDRARLGVHPDLRAHRRTRLSPASCR